MAVLAGSLVAARRSVAYLRYSMSDPARKRPPLRLLAGIALAALLLALLVPARIAEPERALQGAVARALADERDDRLLAAALEQYPEQTPAIAITYGHLELFREQLARFGPQVVPIVAAYQNALTIADALQIAGQALDAVGGRMDADLAPLTPEERGLIALLKMREEGNAFVGQWEITAGGAARRVPSRLVTLGGAELLAGGLTELERRIVQERAVDWRTYGLAAVDLAAIGAGVALLRFARGAARGAEIGRAAGGIVALRSGAGAAARVLGVGVMRYGLPVGVVALMVLHPQVFTHMLWLLAEGVGLPGVLGPLVGWGVVVVPFAFLASWLLLSARALRLAGRALGGAARGCHRLVVRLDRGG
jgi:hypothetical protein